MTASKHFFLLSLCALSCGGAINAYAEDFSRYVDPRQIAIEPQLLNMDSLSGFDMEQFAPNQNFKPPSHKQDKDFISVPRATDNQSPIEEIYSKRLREPITQFGYDLFPKEPNVSSGAAVQDEYILERGDEVQILIRGGENSNVVLKIGEDGMLVVDNLEPIVAAGKSLATVRSELQALVRAMYNTDIFVSLTEPRKINISISGNVTKPGQITLSTFNTVMDAIGAVGGIRKDGSLRQIKIIRGNKSVMLDLYGVLIYGSSTVDISLRDGDRIVVPPIGPTLAVAGASKRPAIYEILPLSKSLWREQGETSQRLTLDDVLDLSGGALLPSKVRYLRLDIDNRSAESVREITNGYERVFGDGDILLIQQADFDMRSGSVTLSGATPQAGLYSLAETPSLAYLLRDKSVFGSDVYPLIGVIKRWDKEHLSSQLIAFSPLQILDHKTDVTLKESDTVVLFSRDDVLNVKAPESDDDIEQISTRPSNKLFDEDVRNFLIEHAVFLRGSIRSAGSYPIANESTLDDLLSVAGGASLEANMQNVEITQPRADKTAKRTSINLASTAPSLITLHPGDTVRIGQNFRRIEDRHVVLRGEVKNPGSYDLIAGDTLSTLIARAGGLTDEAYPRGAIFSRKSERQREEQRYKSQARGLELNLASALQEKDERKKPASEEISLARNLIAEMKGAEALGRITVESDPAMLSAHPELDILLESGDKIFIPKRPLTVRVAGEVLSPAALQFRSGKNPRDYISEAGGFAYNADEDRSFVVYPDGSAQPLSVSAWNNKATKIPPGSTIIVPRDPKPLSFMDGAKDISQILANLATTAIFAEDIADGHN